MKLKSLKDKKGQIGQLPGFFQIMMLVVIFAGLTFIVIDKFLTSIESSSTIGNNATAYLAVNDTANALYDYGVGFLGIVILVVMVYLIISIVSGKKGGGAK